MPSMGASTMNRMVLPNTEASRMPRCGVLVSAAPAKPPISACEDDDGRPHHQVSKFQTMAPIKVAMITLYVTDSSATPLAMAEETCVGKTRNATKLKNAAHTTATRGDNTRVDTTVAIELAASWKPLM